MKKPLPRGRPLAWVRNAIVAAFATLVCAVALGAEASDVTIGEGFITGSEFRNLPVEHRRWYVMGVLDGMLLSPLLSGASASRDARLSACAAGMSDQQVETMVSKYVNDNPELRIESAHTLIYGAFKDACKLSE
jgi:hypothetical protein